MKSLGLDLTIRPDTQFATAYDLDGNPVASLRRRHAFDPAGTPAWTITATSGEVIGTAENGVKARRVIADWRKAEESALAVAASVRWENEIAANPEIPQGFIVPDSGARFSAIAPATLSKSESLASIADKAAARLGIVAKPVSIVGEPCDASGLLIRIEVAKENESGNWFDAFADTGEHVAMIYGKANGSFDVIPLETQNFNAESLKAARLMLHNLIHGQREAMAKLETLPPAGRVDLCDAATLETIREAIRAMGFQTFDYDAGGAKYVAVSAENGDNAADYYGEYRGGYPWINPKLESLATRCGAYWEWINPGAIMLNL